MQDPEMEEDARFFLDLTSGLNIPNCCLLIGIDSMFELDSAGDFVSEPHEAEKNDFLKKLARALSQELEDIYGFPVMVISES